MRLSRLRNALLGFCVLACVAGCAQREQSGQDDGGQLEGAPGPRFRGGDITGDKNFARLINGYAESKLEPTPWAGWWWPYKSNGIANATSFGTSPAAKYDAARGRHGSNSAQSWEAANHGAHSNAGNVKVEDWWGHCNGWSAAAALFPEPHEPVKVNGIEFGIADIKALLTEAAMESSSDFFGNRVEMWSPRNAPEWDDVVPDQYFLVLTNYIGIRRQPVLIDRDTGYQIWNQPLAGYRFKYPTPADYLGPDPAAPNVYRINLESTMWWVEDGVAPDAQTPNFDFEDNGYFSSRTLRMEVWLDGPVVFGADGKIQSSGNVIVTRKGDFYVGGAWRTGFEDWPDYMWIPWSVQKPTDYANKEIDIDWIKAHILVPGGADDPSANPSSPEAPPVSSPRPTTTGFPFPEPPRPAPTLTPVPVPTVAPIPTSRPRP